MLNDFSDCAESDTGCRSNEDLKASFEDFNKLNKDVRKKCRIISMDVKALYPSMSWSEIVKAVQEMILNSKMEIQNVDWSEVGKYFAVMMTKDEIEQDGLVHTIPKRRGLRLKLIQIRYLHQKKNKKKGQPARKPGVRQQRKMLPLAV